MSINKLSNDLVEATKKVMTAEEEYKEFFAKALKKFKVNSPADFKSDEEKKKFFDYIDKNDKGKSEDISKMQEWIAAGGERRRVKEGDARKTKVEDVIRGMWEESAGE